MARSHFGGNSEIDCNDLVQKSIHAVTNGNELSRTAKLFKGNTLDMRMNDDMIGFLADKADLERTMIFADCMLANETIIDELLRLGWGPSPRRHPASTVSRRIP